MDHRLTRNRAIFFDIGGVRKVYFNQDTDDEIEIEQNVQDGTY